MAIAFELTHRCNLNCPHCYAQDDVKQLGKEEYFKILDEIRKAGCAIVSFTGGEPLLVSYLPELIKRAKELGMWVQYTTNGVLLPAREEELKQVSADMIQVSLDGDAHSHGKSRGEGTFEKALKALEVVKRNHWRCLIVCVLNKYSTKESIAFALVKALDVGAFISFQPLCDLPELSPSKNQLTELLDFLKEVRKSKNQKQFCDILREHKTGHLLDETSFETRKFYNPMNQSMSLLNCLYKFPDYGALPCTAGKLFARIRPDGQLVPCYYAIDREHPVNVVKDGFKKSWQNLNFPECVNCWHHHRLVLNLIYNFSIPTLTNVLYYHLNKKFDK
ncbi:MAG: radical SAM protein [Candidatus Omnitrophica bacterium]|nr:radical SAM protein [Candidatus Omnitrophota bacterium]